MCIHKPYNKYNYKIDGCFVDPEERFAFIHIYKNASISFRNALNMRGRYFKYIDVKDKGLVTVCILRNPIDRVISMYLYLLRLEDNGYPNQHPIEETKKSCFYKNQDDVIESFKYFLNAISDNNYYDAVTYPQIKFIEDRGLNINDIDEIMLEKNLSWEYKEFKEKYKIKNDLDFPNDNVGNEEKKKLISNYIKTNFNIKMKIMNMYREDIQMYNTIALERNVNILI